jgi:hypothetical protein
MGDQAPAASSTTMEAAEQLIQLSGGCDEGGGVSESKSADSVKAAGEKHRGDYKEGVTAVVESSSAGKKGGGEDDDAVMGGVKRRRPRFRSLAAIYRATKRIDLVPIRDEAEEDRSSEGKEKKGKKKRAAGGAAHDEPVAAAAPSKASRVVRGRSSTVRES